MTLKPALVSDATDSGLCAQRLSRFSVSLITPTVSELYGIPGALGGASTVAVEIRALERIGADSVRKGLRSGAG